MRPLGDITKAMWEAALHPGTVRELAARARVGYDVARYTASRMVDRGQLAREPGTRPAVLSAVCERPAPLLELHEALAAFEAL